MKECPFCHEQLMEEQSFCPACMRELYERTVFRPKKSPGRKLRMALFLLGILLLSGAAAVMLKAVLFRRGQSVSGYLPSFETFQKTAAFAVSERYPGLWDPFGLVPAEPVRGLFPENTEADSCIWAKGHSDALSSDFTLAFSEEGGEAALLFALDTEEEYENAFLITETFLSGLFQRYLEMPDLRGVSSVSEGEDALIRTFQPSSGEPCVITFSRTTGGDGDAFSFSVLIRPEAS